MIPEEAKKARIKDFTNLKRISHTKFHGKSLIVMMNRMLLCISDVFGAH